MKLLAFLIIFCTKILIVICKPSWTPTFITTAKLIEVQGLAPYRRFISYPVYILITEGGDLKGCTLTDSTDVGTGLSAGNEIDTDAVSQNEDEVAMDTVPEIDPYSAVPKIM